MRAEHRVETKGGRAVLKRTWQPPSQKYYPTLSPHTPHGEYNWKETVEQFICALSEAADRCECPDRSTQIRDRIVVGVRDQTVSRKMQKMEVDHLTEAKAVSLVREAEEVDRQMRELNVHTQVDAVRTRSRHVRATAQSRTQSTKWCTRCGRIKHTQGQCPAMERKCRSCGHIGHYAVCCRSNTRTRNHQSKANVNVGNVDKDNVSLLGEISGNRNSWTELVQVPGMRLPVMFKLDTGADVSVVPSRLCRGYAGTYYKETDRTRGHTRYAFNRLPFGLSSSPEIFQKVVSEILEGLEGVICHMDDIYVWGASLQQHDHRVRSVLNRLKDAGMTLNASKCEFAVDRIRFLGHVISSTGVCANPDAVQGLNDFKTPVCE